MGYAVDIKTPIINNGKFDPNYDVSVELPADFTVNKSRVLFQQVIGKPHPVTRLDFSEGLSAPALETEKEEIDGRRRGEGKHSYIDEYRLQGMPDHEGVLLYEVLKAAAPEYVGDEVRFAVWDDRGDKLRSSDPKRYSGTASTFAFPHGREDGVTLHVKGTNDKTLGKEIITKEMYSGKEILTREGNEVLFETFLTWAELGLQSADMGEYGRVLFDALLGGSEITFATLDNENVYQMMGVKNLPVQQTSMVQKPRAANRSNLVYDGKKLIVVNPTRDEVEKAISYGRELAQFMEGQAAPLRRAVARIAVAGLTHDKFYNNQLNGGSLQHHLERLGGIMGTDEARVQSARMQGKLDELVTEELATINELVDILRRGFPQY